MTDEIALSAPYRRWLKTLASPAILFYALPWLMVLLVAGTLAQREYGLFTAQHLYFSSWVFWAGPFPLPGAYLTLGAITVCLLTKFLFFSPWRWQQVGIILSHLGVLVLLIGGIVTAFSQKEGFMMIGEGQESQVISDYHQRVLRIEKDGQEYAQVPFEKLIKGERIEDVDLPFDVQVENVCQNCRPVPARDTTGRYGLAQQIMLTSAEPEKEDESNLSGVTLALSGLPEAQDGTYLTLEEIPHKPTVTINGAAYAFHMGRAQTSLPFEINLKKFAREVHPGTDMARGFSSDVVVKDGALSWPYLIRMNEPLRYKGYTFYQASFSLRPDGQYSILSVVQNKGRIFPYLASAMIFAGLLIHVMIRLRTGKRPS